jgi:DNA replication initiation complex subunit (GINS family)
LIETNADRFYRILEDENSSKDLLKIPANTYQQIAAHIKSIRSESSEGERDLPSSLSLAERKILNDLARRLMQLRIEKFARDPEADVANLTFEERYIVEPLIQSRKRFDRMSESILAGHVGELEHAATAVKQKYVFVRFLQPYGAITGIDMGVYGPFESEDMAILPVENAKNLVKNGIISTIWIEPEDQR